MQLLYFGAKMVYRQVMSNSHSQDTSQPRFWEELGVIIVFPIIYYTTPYGVYI